RRRCPQRAADTPCGRSFSACLRREEDSDAQPYESESGSEERLCKGFGSVRLLVSGDHVRGNRHSAHHDNRCDRHNPSAPEDPNNRESTPNDCCTSPSFHPPTSIPARDKRALLHKSGPASLVGKRPGQGTLPPEPGPRQPGRETGTRR